MNMEKRIPDVRIPRELKRLILKRRLVRLFLFGLLIALNLVVILNWWDDLFPIEKINPIAKYSFAVVLLAIPVFLTRIYRIFTDPTFTGTVRDVSVRTSVDSKSSVRPTWESLYRKNEIYLTVETPGGKVIRKKVYEGMAKDGANLEKYHVGDRVLHLHGSGITVVLPFPNDSRCCCAVCGGDNSVSDSVCVHCGKPLVK